MLERYESNVAASEVWTLFRVGFGFAGSRQSSALIGGNELCLFEKRSAKSVQHNVCH